MGFRTSLHPLGRVYNPYKPNQIIISASGQNEAMVADFDLPAGTYYIEAIGGGGAGSHSVSLVAMGSGGGSGGIIAGYFRIPQGRYSFTSGIKGYDSNMDSVPQNTVMPSGGTAGLYNQNKKEWVALAHGGSGATRPVPAGTAGQVISSRYQVGNLTAFSAGANGTNGGGWSAGVGGGSIYNGFGKGGDGNAKNSNTHGWFKLVYVSD